MSEFLTTWTLLCLGYPKWPSTLVPPGWDHFTWSFFLLRGASSILRTFLGGTSQRDTLNTASRLFVCDIWLTDPFPSPLFLFPLSVFFSFFSFIFFFPSSHRHRHPFLQRTFPTENSHQTLPMEIPLKISPKKIPTKESHQNWSSPGHPGPTCQVHLIQF